MDRAEAVELFLSGRSAQSIATEAETTVEDVEDALRRDLMALRRGYNAATAIMRSCARGFGRLHEERRASAVGSPWLRASRLGAAEAFWRACQALGHGLNMLAAVSMHEPEKEAADG